MKEQHHSGFVCINNGTIQHCNSFVKCDKNRMQHAFCENNHGAIEDSICIYSSRKSAKDITFANNSSKIQNCRILGYSDYKLHTENTSTNTIKMQSIEATEADISISSVSQLYEIAEKINHGDLEAASASYSLTCDIDLKNKKWIPIGMSEMTPFCGSFHGNGHSIKHFIISNKKLEAAGFFGYLKNANVHDLSIDCIIKTGIYAGSIAGVSVGSTVENCYAKANIWNSRYIGGLISKNDGMIRNCQFNGHLVNPHPLYALWVFTITCAIIVASFYTRYLIYPALIPDSTTATPTVGSYYPPIEVDENSKKIPDDNQQSETSTNSASFVLKTTITAETGDSKAQIDFENPGKSNQGIRLELQITDQELINMIGKTGRTLVEQQALEADSNYSPETSRMIVAESGNILPGYELESLQLNPLPDGTILPAGTYNAIIYMFYYNISTNEMAMLKTQTPVILVIKN